MRSVNKALVLIGIVNFICGTSHAFAESSKSLHLTLMDAQSAKPIISIPESGMSISKAQVAGKITFLAESTKAAKSAHMRITLLSINASTGRASVLNQRTVAGSRGFLFAGNGSKLTGRTLSAGSYELRTRYEKVVSGRTSLITSRTAKFKIVRVEVRKAASISNPISMTLIDTNGNKSVATFQVNTPLVVSQASMPTKATVLAELAQPITDVRVRMVLYNITSAGWSTANTQDELHTPYLLFSNTDNTFYGRTFAPGKYGVQAQLFLGNTFLGSRQEVLQVLGSTTVSPTPTTAPTKAPTAVPTKVATVVATKTPTKIPTTAATKTPTSAPTSTPTKTPTKRGTAVATIGDTGGNSPAGLPSKTPTPTATATKTATPTPTRTAVPTSSSGNLGLPSNVIMGVDHSYNDFHTANFPGTSDQKAAQKLLLNKKLRDELGAQGIRDWQSITDWYATSFDLSSQKAFHNLGLGVVSAVTPPEAKDCAVASPPNGCTMPGKDDYSKVYNYFSRLASAANGAIDYYEIVNEPNLTNYYAPGISDAGKCSDFVNYFLKPAATALHDKGQFVLGPSVTGSAGSLGCLANAGMLNYVDGASFHPYGSTLSQNLANLQGALDVVGSKPLFLTEWNIVIPSSSVNWSKAVTEAVQQTVAMRGKNGAKVGGIFYYRATVADSTSGFGGLYTDTGDHREPYYSTVYKMLH